MMMKRVMKAIVMKKNRVRLFIDFYQKPFLKNLDEADLSEDEVSADPIEGNSISFSIENNIKFDFLEAPKGEKRKRDTDNQEENGGEIDDDGPPHKI